jgi:ketosteroid isomerase-like protein
MRDVQTIADRVEIEALRGEFTDAAMMRDYDRLASLFTPDGALRMPNIPVDLAGQEQIRAWGERVPDLVDFLVQTTHPGTIALHGDTASGRAYIHELGRARDGRQGLNYAIYHDRYGHRFEHDEEGHVDRLIQGDSVVRVGRGARPVAGPLRRIG